MIPKDGSVASVKDGIVVLSLNDVTRRRKDKREDEELVKPKVMALDDFLFADSPCLVDRNLKSRNLRRK